MDLVSSVDIVNTPSYQHAPPRLIDAAMAACTKAQKRKREITAEDMAALNDAVEPVIPVSVETATAYCVTMAHIVWGAGADKQNRITAGVATVALVLTAMTSHVENKVLQEKGAEVLVYLACDNPVNIVGILALGGLETLIAAADTHIASAYVQESVCWALYRIAEWSADGRTALRASRAAEVATRAKDLYPGLVWPDELLRTLSAE